MTTWQPSLSGREGRIRKTTDNDKNGTATMRLGNAYLVASCALLLSACSTRDAGNGAGAVSVRVERVQAGAASAPVGYSGTIEEMTATALGFSAAGTIATMEVDEGSTVSRGQVLATLDGQNQSSMLMTAQSALEMSLETLAQAEDAYERMSRLHDAGTLPDIQWVDVQTKLGQARSSLKAARSQVAIAEKAMADTRLVAPYGGFVSSRMAGVGQQAAPGVPIVRIVDISRVRARFSVPEAEIGGFSLGDDVTVEVGASGEGPVRGRVSQKGVSADRLSRCYDVWATLPNPGWKLLPGMLCEVTRDGVLEGWAVTVRPAAVLLDEDNRHFVWCLRDGKAERRYVRLGGNAGSRVIVLEGLAPGDEIITDGAQKVSQGTPCTVKG